MMMTQMTMTSKEMRFDDALGSFDYDRPRLRTISLMSGGWKTSSFSLSNNDCVEVRKGTVTGILIRDSKDKTKRQLYFDNEEWDAFIKGVKAGEFDRSEL